MIYICRICWTTGLTLASKRQFRDATFKERRKYLPNGWKVVEVFLSELTNRPVGQFEVCPDCKLNVSAVVTERELLDGNDVEHVADGTSGAT